MIDDGNTEDWPNEVTAALSRFRQGSLVPSPPFAYHAGTAHPIWAASRQVDPTEPIALVELDPLDLPPFGIITSQGCDVDEEGKNLKPWVQIAPVYELAPDDQRLSQVRNWKVAYLAPVTALGVNWVADLRIEFPVEKSWLALQASQDAFTTPDEFRHFGAFCARNRERPALATAVYDEILHPVRAGLRTLRQTFRELWDEWIAGVSHTFLELGGDPLSPTSAQMIFISDQPLSERLIEQLDFQWESIFGGKNTGIAVLPNRYLTIAEVSFAESRRWHDVDQARLTES